MDIIGYFKHQGKRFYPLTHTKAVYDNNGIRLEDRLNQMGTEVTVSQSGLMSPSDKAKLDGMAVGANNYTHPSSHDASMITQDSTHRFVTDTEKSTWNNKANLTYCTCATPVSTAEKIAEIAVGTFELKEGASVEVKFKYTNTATAPTLNVNGTGAKPIKAYGTTAPDIRMWQANSVVRFTYDGENWLMLNGTKASTSYYGVTKLSSSVSSTSTSEAATSSAVKSAYDLANNAIPKTQRGAANGVASLDIDGKVPLEQIPDGVVTGVKGGSESAYRTGNVNITKANIGLGNVDNTSDANKPISTAVQTALNDKASVNHTHTVDSALSSTSINPVQNKVVNGAIDGVNSKIDTFLDCTDYICISEISDAIDSKLDANVIINGFAGIGEITEKLSDCSRSVTFVVGASNSRYNCEHIQAVDFYCTPTDAHTTINQAIAALPSSGGKIILLEGTYNISGAITINKDNVTIEGMGAGTVLKRMGTNFDIIRMTSVQHCTVKNLCIDGNKASYPGSGNMYQGEHGVGLDTCSLCNINNIYIHDEYNGICSWSGGYLNTYENNIVADCGAYGIGLYYNTTSAIKGNTIRNTKNGIGIDYLSERIIISGNLITDPAEAGINIISAASSNIVNNVVLKKSSGTQYTISLRNSTTRYNLVAFNQLPNMPYTDSTGNNTNTFVNNI